MQVEVAEEKEDVLIRKSCFSRIKPRVCNLQPNVSVVSHGADSTCRFTEVTSYVAQHAVLIRIVVPFPEMPSKT